MVAIKALTVLALAGAISAVPVANPVGEALVRREPWDGRPHYSWSWRWGGQGSKPESQPAATTPAAAAETPASTPSTDSGNTGSTSGSSTGSSDASASTPAASSGGSSGGSGYIGIVNTWRSNMGLSALTEDSKLQSNAQDAANSSGGQLVHKLNPGSMAQVMAPGNSGNFESVFVGGWLCEMPNLPGLGSSVCNSASQGWDHAGQTGHAQILTSGSYSKIGCGLGDGIWACDLA